MTCLIQGTDEWLELRRSKITASDAAIIMGVNPWSSLDKLREEKLGLAPPKKKTAKMQRGLDLEDTAREYFTVYTGIKVEPKVIFHSQNDWMMASLDGISVDKHCIVEIKCPDPFGSSHKDAQSGMIPSIYYPQVQHQIAVANVDKAYYLSFDGDVFGGVLLEIPRNDIYIEELIEKEKAFYDSVVEIKKATG